jgi:hypothetical protein
MMAETDREVLMWLHDRLVNIHGESDLYDYMHRLRAIIQATNKTAVHREGGYNSLKEMLQEDLEQVKEELVEKSSPSMEALWRLVDWSKFTGTVWHNGELRIEIDRHNGEIEVIQDTPIAALLKVLKVQGGKR